MMQRHSDVDVADASDHELSIESATTRLERRFVIGLIAVAFALRAGFALTVPAFQAPDERAHFAVVRTLVEHHALPVQPDLTPDQALRGWPQAYQPPLAYLSFVPAAAISRALGAGAGVQLRVLRLQNALYGALLVGVAYGLARRLRPRGDPLRVLTPLFVAALPGLASNAGSLNNDALANLLAATLWWVWLSEESGARRSVAVGVVFGAACVTKLTAASLAPLLLLTPWLQRRSLPSALREACTAGAVALLLLLPWMVRNMTLYGDPLALGTGSFAFEKLAGELPHAWLAEARSPAPGKALLQLFGRFGITNNLSWWPVPWVWLSLAGVGVAGWLRRSATPDPPGSRAARACFALAVLLACVGLAGFSLRYYGAWQGRYLYVCIAPIAWLSCEGGARLLPRARGDALLALVLLAILLLGLDAALLWKLGDFFDGAAQLWGLRTAL